MGRAVFSPDRRYRWWLERLWCPAAPRLLFIGLNPSTGDGRRDDPTLRRLLGFARTWGFGALEVVNLFARVSTRPAVLRTCRDPVGKENDGWITSRLRVLVDAAGGPQRGPAAVVWIGWGHRGTWLGRNAEVLELVRAAGAVPACLALTACGQPRHPLYSSAALHLQVPAALCEAVPLPSSQPWSERRVATPSIC